MKNVQQRIALLAGVSISAFGVAAPAAAASVAGTGHSVTGASVEDVLTICAIGDSCDSGAAGIGAGLVNATVNSVASGEIRQVGTATAAGGDVALTMSNAGDAAISAIATASASAGAASAFALIAPGIVQSGLASGDVALDFTNDGTLLIDAMASASGTHALAAASVNIAIHQFADSTGTGDASAAMTNNGELSIAVGAVANGDTGATAVANIYRGIGNYAGALGSGDAIASLDNGGDIAISAAASAAAAGTTGTAHAVAFISNAIQQTVYAQSGLASGSIDNSGTIAIAADAFASAVTTAPVTGSSAGMDASAEAYNSYAIDQTGSAASGDVALDFSNSGTIDISVGAQAVAAGANSGTAGGLAFATAYMHDALYQHGYAPGGDIAIEASNAGTMDVSAVAAATGAIAIAQAQIEYGISQYASAAGGNADVGFTNSGAINETAAAVAHGTGGFGFGLAVVTSALFQLASAAGDANVHFDNEGILSAHATGVADGGSAGAGAFVNEAIEQFALASGAGAAAMTNSGTIALDAVAAASATSGHGTGIAFVSHGISQHAYAGTGASVSLTNSGKINIAASGSAVAATRAFGEAAVFDAIYQSASASGAATASFVNSGTLEISADAHGDGEVGRAIAVIAPAVVQQAWSPDARVTLDNSGKIDVSAIAHGVGTIGAPVLADAFGVVQYAGSGTAEFLNSGDFDVLASGHATATGRSAFVGVSAAGLVQYAGGGTNRFDNSGTFSVKAVAEANGTGGFVGGSATGYAASGSAATLDIDNSGTFSVDIEGAAPNQAFVGAYGMEVQAFGSFASGSSVPTQQALIDGTITNSGDIVVKAHASGAPMVFGSGASATTFPGSAAYATGIYLNSGVDKATVTNSGTILIEAMTADGGTALANGVLVLGNGSGAPATADDVFTFNNDGGTIVVRQSNDGGESWHRGMAIDVSQAPNASVINLTRNGAIYGNVAVQAGDEINVADGTTYFDGIVNPGSLPFNGLHANDLDSGLHGVGTLNIKDGGNLVLADPRITGNPAMYDGPAYALVDTLNMDSGGTLTFQLQPASGGAQPVGSYPQVFADSANLDGTLVADVTTANGLFADSYSWDNVIDANVRNGTFDKCVLGGADAGSLLLSLSCSYDSNANVDLALTRVAFDQVAGLNGNGAAVGSGLECIYDVGLTGGAADMFADLFLITDPAKYNVALNQLSGSAYANYLNSFASLGAHYDDLVDHATDCDVPAVGGSILECRAGSPVHIWGQLDYQTRKADGDSEAGTTRSKRFTGQVGIDAAVSDAAVVGVEAGWVTNHLRDRQFGDSIDGKGAQAGLYAAYDPGAFFVKGIGTYSWFNGDSTRHVDFTGLAAGAAFKGTPTAHPDANLLTAGLHGGARLPVGGGSVATPYLNLDYVRARLNGFTESGLSGANLSVESSRSSRTFVTGGVKWAAQLGGVVPELNLGYRHRFGDERSAIRAFFNGDADCDFDVVSAAQKKGTFLAGLSVGGRIGPVDVRVGYEGEFNGDVTSHSGNFKFVLPLGGHAAPPPPAVAAPAAVVAPPPAPVEAAPPLPPAPAPTERGERGR